MEILDDDKKKGKLEVVVETFEEGVKLLKFVKTKLDDPRSDFFNESEEIFLTGFFEIGGKIKWYWSVGIQATRFSNEDDIEFMKRMDTAHSSIKKWMRQYLKTKGKLE